VYSSILDKMASDARELSQSVNDQNEYHNLMTQIDTNVDAIKNALSGFSISLLQYLSRFPFKKCTVT